MSKPDKKQMARLLQRAAHKIKTNEDPRQDQIFQAMLELYCSNKLGSIHDEFSAFIAAKHAEEWRVLKQTISSLGGENALYDRIISKFNLSVRKTLLRHAPSLRSLLAKTPADVEALKGFGSLRVTELRLALQAFGLDLAMSKQNIEYALGTKIEAKSAMAAVR